MNIGYIASTEEGSVLEQVMNEIPKHGKHPICQTSVKRHNKLFNGGNPSVAECAEFASRHKMHHIINLNTNTLHKKGCRYVKGVENVIEARIVNAKSTGLKLCKCCK